MSDQQIDPVEYGKVVAEVAALRREIDELKRDVKRLLALMEQSRGAAWVGKGLIAVAAAAVGWIAEKVWH